MAVGLTSGNAIFMHVYEGDRFTGQYDVTDFTANEMHMTVEACEARGRRVEFVAGHYSLDTLMEVEP